MDYSHPDLADRLAAGYVAGTLRGPARRRFEALLPAHPLLRGAVREWQTRLMPLTVSVQPQKPPPEVWKRIEARIGGAAVAAQAPRKSPIGWWQRLDVWRSLAARVVLAIASASAKRPSSARTRASTRSICSVRR